MTNPNSALRIKLFADGAQVDAMAAAYQSGLIQGFTTNPTLMRKAGVTDYTRFARQVLDLIPDRPISFEVFSDDFDAMEREARVIAGWGPNVNVKIPVTDTRGQFSGELIKRLSGDGVSLNITACLTLGQVLTSAACLSPDVPAIVSVFAGRIADTGVDPVPIMRLAAEALKPLPRVELLWASTREVLNVVQAEEAGCHIITLTEDIFRKLKLLGKDLNELSLETVKMFYHDAQASGYSFADA